MASLTQEDSSCFKYMLSLYLHNNVQFGVSKQLMECLTEFNKWQNITFLVEWLEEKQGGSSLEEKSIFLAGAIDRHIDDVLAFCFGSRD
jgi:hypothetical protein